jgi:DegV family protein with EDD domain
MSIALLMKFEKHIQTMRLKYKKVANRITSSSSLSNKMSIAIVTDSTADIPAKIAEENNITVVPAILVIEGRSLEDGTGITRQDFYNQLPTMKNPPSTATPSTGTFQRVYEKLFQDGFHSIISIHVSSLLSGIFNTAELTAKAFDSRVKVIDSGQLSLGIGFQALGAAEAAAKGFSLQAVLQEVESIRQRVRVIAMLDTLEYVRRSGRVSWARTRIGSLLNIKPFLEVKNGQILSRGQVRTRTKGLEYLIEIFEKIGAIEKLAILHTNAEAEAQQLLSRLNTTLSEPPMIVNVTTIVGTHVGPNGLGFSAVTK